MLKLSTLIIMIFISTTIINSQENKTDSNPFSQSKFVPDISLIIDASYKHFNFENHESEHLILPGVIKVTHAENGLHQHATTQKGFNLNYGELYISSVVDPYFELLGIFHIGRSGLEIEEGYFTTRKLPSGLQLKGGKFYSAFGRINEQHPHLWDFADQPLIFNSFFGSEGLNEVGIQTNWIAPTNFFLKFGVEILEGENESSFGKNGFNVNSVEVESSELPNLYTSFISTSFDAGNLVGFLKLSGAIGKTRIQNNYDIDHNNEAFYANTKIFGLSFSGKYFVNPVNYLSLQTEYLKRNMKGNRYSIDTSGVSTHDYESVQSGLYAQLIYKFNQRWRIGVRYDYIQNNMIKINSSDEILPKYLPRYSAMIDFSPTEFSMIRFQYSYDRSKYVIEQNNYLNKNLSEFILQINLSIGAHGAHPF